VKNMLALTILIAVASVLFIASNSYADVGVNRPGFDYTDFDLPDDNSARCEAACARDPRCQAWTFVRRHVQGPGGKMLAEIHDPSRSTG
jgi:hypothetical protein